MALSLAVLVLAAAAPLSSDDCLGCHADKDLKNARGAAVFDPLFERSQGVKQVGSFATSAVSHSRREKQP